MREEPRIQRPPLRMIPSTGSWALPLRWLIRQWIDERQDTGAEEESHMSSFVAVKLDHSEVDTAFKIVREAVGSEVIAEKSLL